MPRRFYCRAKWHASGLDSETQVFDLDFVDRDGRQLGGIREFTVKRAPREALLRGLGGDATRLLYTLGWHEVPPPASSDECRKCQRHLADCRIRRTGRPRAWLHLVRPEHRSGALGADVGTGSRTRPAVLRRRLAQHGAERRRVERRTDLVARLETEIANLLSAVHTVQGGSQNGGVKLPGGLWISHRAGRGNRIRRAGRPGAGGAVGIRTHHDQRGTGAALQTGR